MSMCFFFLSLFFLFCAPLAVRALGSFHFLHSGVVYLHLFVAAYTHYFSCISHGFMDLGWAGLDWLDWIGWKGGVVSFGNHFYVLLFGRMDVMNEFGNRTYFLLSSQVYFFSSPCPLAISST